MPVKQPTIRLTPREKALEQRRFQISMSEAGLDISAYYSGQRTEYTGHLNEDSVSKIEDHRSSMFSDACNDLSLARSLLKEFWFTERLEDYARRRHEIVKDAQGKDTRPYDGKSKMFCFNSVIRAYMETKIDADPSSPFSELMDWYKSLPPPPPARSR